ncbi:MAG TPA: hypothetical protein VNT75_08770 [Symbiobacteriaceae bacterium]|nr:hypothetical protein [Symbiobacteriaceae bacterium]
MDFLNGASAGEAVLFSAIAYVVPLLLGWWIFFSRVQGQTMQPARPAPRQAAVLAILLAAGGLSMTFGGIWDAMKHAKTGAIPSGADFLWAPHIMLYASFLAMFAVAVYAMGRLAADGWRAGVRDPRLWLRQNPGVGGLAVAALYAILSIPGDAIWHAIFGVDLTAWSIPHMMLGLSGNAVNLCALSLFLRSRPRSADRGVRDVASVIFLAIVLNLLSLLGVLEWEVPGGALTGVVLHRPVWLYPVVFGGLSFVTLLVGRRLISRWGATAVALAAYALRAAFTAAMGAADYPMPYFLPVMLLGAILLDVVPWDRVRTGLIRYAGVALTFTAGYLALALPILISRPGLPAFSGGDIALSFAVMVAVAIALQPAGESLAAKLK